MTATKMILRKLTLDSFKGVRHAEYDLGYDKATISGQNGTGKTTIADAWYWLLTDKDYDMQANPDVRPDYMAESEPSVTAIVAIGGKDVKLRKYQSDMRTKKQKIEGAPVRISNKYEINDVPKSQKDFIKALTDAGIPVELILMLSHPEYCMGLKNADLRKMLFDMVEDVTDLDVARQTPGCEKVVKLLENYTLEEIGASHKATLARAKKMEVSIPEQIIGMEKSKVEIDPELPAKKEQAEKELASLNAEYDRLRRETDTGAIEARIRQLQSEKVAAYNRANEERLAQLRDAQKALNTAESTYNYACASVVKYEQEIERMESLATDYTVKMQECKSEASALRNSKFKGRTVCPACGQKLPKDQVATAKQKWDAETQERIGALDEAAEKCKVRKAEVKDRIKELTEKKKEALAGRKEAEGDKRRTQLEVDKLSTPVKANTAFFDRKITELEQQKSMVSAKLKEIESVMRRVAEKKSEIEQIIKEQAKELNNTYIDENIAHMREEQKKYIQVKANCEAILYQLWLISSRKNDMLSDAVNSHFRDVKFRLFYVQKNGEVKDDCTPMVRCSDGEYREIQYSANTAAITAGKLDICRGLQEYHGVRLPIFLDGAECLDEKNRAALKSDTQLIMLCVSEDKELKFD